MDAIVGNFRRREYFGPQRDPQCRSARGALPTRLGSTGNSYVVRPGRSAFWQVDAAVPVFTAVVQPEPTHLSRNPRGVLSAVYRR